MEGARASDIVSYSSKERWEYAARTYHPYHLQALWRVFDTMVVFQEYGSRTTL